MALAAVGLGRVAIARADGAFPDAQTILVPGAHPEEIILATNFGVILSEDGGATWQWSCEVVANAYGILYQQSPPPRRRVYAVAGAGVVFSDDLTCTWSVAGGALPISSAVDLFVERSGGDRVFAVASECCDATGGGTFSVHTSNDGGTTFGPALYTAPSGTSITGIESALSDPATIYLTLSQVGASTATATPLLARSGDGGGRFEVHDLSGQLGSGQLRIVSVDRSDPRRVLLLRTAGTADALVITRDGGATATAPVQPSGRIKSIFETSAGSILVATDDGGLPSLLRSQDHGQTFQAVFNPPHVRGLAERDGKVYAATDNARDGHAIAVSSDQGTTWSALMDYGQVRSIVPCLKVSCQDACVTEAFLGLWPASVCAADGVPLPNIGDPTGGRGGGGAEGGSNGAAGAAGLGGRAGEEGGAGGGALAGQGADGSAAGAGIGGVGGGAGEAGAGGGPAHGSGSPSGGCATAGSAALDVGAPVGCALALVLTFAGRSAVRAVRAARRRCRDRR